jgi:hypothetical protein
MITSIQREKLARELSRRMNCVVSEDDVQKRCNLLEPCWERMFGRKATDQERRALLASDFTLHTRATKRPAPSVFILAAAQSDGPPQPEPQPVPMPPQKEANRLSEGDDAAVLAVSEARPVLDQVAARRRWAPSALVRLTLLAIIVFGIGFSIGQYSKRDAMLNVSRQAFAKLARAVPGSETAGPDLAALYEKELLDAEARADAQSYPPRLWAVMPVGWGIGIWFAIVVGGGVFVVRRFAKRMNY